MVMARWPWPSSFPGSAALAGDGGSDALGIEAGAGPHLAGRGEIDHQHAHRSVALRLQNEAAVELQRRTEHHREHDRLAEQFRNRRRIIVAGQNGIDRSPEPHDAAAQVERFDGKRQDRVVDRFRCGRPDRDADLGIVHCQGI